MCLATVYKTDDDSVILKNTSRRDCCRRKDPDGGPGEQHC